MKRAVQSLIIVALMGVTSLAFIRQGAYLIRQSSTHVGDDPLSVYAAPLLAINTPPSFSTPPFMDPNTVNENGVATLKGHVTDPDPGDSCTLEVDWGDGSSKETFSFNPCEADLNIPHRFLDDVPSKTASDVETITLRLFNSGGNGNGNSGNGNGGGSTTTNTTETVNNVAPDLHDVAATSPVRAGRNTKLTGTIDDPGSRDTFTVTISWGDGKVSTLRLGNKKGKGVKFSAPHKYKAPGNFTINVSVDDDDTGHDQCGDGDDPACPVVTVNPKKSSPPPGPATHPTPTPTATPRR